MRKYIDGKRYDTDTAHKVGQYENMCDVRDFHWYSETLYRKKNREYFLHGEGGARSKYCKPLGNSSWAGGERIMPLTYDEARKWAEDNLDVDEYEAEFGVPDEDGESVQLNCMISAKAFTIIRQAAQREGKTISDIVESLAKTLETV